MIYSASFPATRLRRLRTQPWIRDMVQENHLLVSDLIYPVFIRAPDGPAQIQSMPGVLRYTISELPGIIQQILEAGLLAVGLFPYTPHELKTNNGEEALNAENLICQAIRYFKKSAPHIGVFTDVALDPYTSHGHDGVWNGVSVDNDVSVDVLARQALVQAEAGADVLAPSDMMDGRVGAIRQILDNAGYHDRAIMSYAAKYASAFYGPFREAVGAAKLPPNQGQVGNKKTYQMNPANSEEALREVSLDVQEGADMVLIKPGLPYLDVIHKVRYHFKVPTFAYQVSGEYSMIKAAGANGWIDEHAVMEESLISMKRAGATAIFTYAALEIAQKLKSL